MDGDFGCFWGFSVILAPVVIIKPATEVAFLQRKSHHPGRVDDTGCYQFFIFFSFSGRTDVDDRHPPISFASRSWSFSGPESDLVSSIWLRSCFTRPYLGLGLGRLFFKRFTEGHIAVNTDV